MDSIHFLRPLSIQQSEYKTKCLEILEVSIQSHPYPVYHIDEKSTVLHNYHYYRYYCRYHLMILAVGVVPAVDVHAVTIPPNYCPSYQPQSLCNDNYFCRYFHSHCHVFVIVILNRYVIRYIQHHQ